jgi:hypothetical protein
MPLHRQSMGSGSAQAAKSVPDFWICVSLGLLEWFSFLIQTAISDMGNGGLVDRLTLLVMESIPSHSGSYPMGSDLSPATSRCQGVFWGEVWPLRQVARPVTVASASPSRARDVCRNVRQMQVAEKSPCARFPVSPPVLTGWRRRPSRHAAGQRCLRAGRPSPPTHPPESADRP